jgi:hypothetical protein
LRVRDLTDSIFYGYWIVYPGVSRGVNMLNMYYGLNPL